MRGFWTDARIAGLLMVLGLLISVAAAVIIITSGVDFGRLISPTAEGFEEMKAHISAYTLSTRLGAVSGLVILSGMAILSGLLRRAGDDTMSLMGLAAFTVSIVLFTIELAFLTRVPMWIAAEVPSTGSVPDFYAPMRAWMSGLQLWTIISGLIGLLGYGVSILRTDILPDALGWFYVVVSAILLVVDLAGGGTPVGVIYLLPVVIGLALLVKPVPDS